MKSQIRTYASAFTTLFSLLAALFCVSCKDIVFDNPLDPDASAAAVQVIKVVTTSLGGKGDICFDGEKFWKIDAYGNLDALDIETGIVIRSLSAVPGPGIAFFKDKLYIGRGENILYALDSLSGEIVDRIATTDLYPSFLAANGDSLIIFDQRSTSFLAYDPDSGASNRLFQVSGLDIGGIQVYRGGLLVTDMNSDSIYHFSISGAVLNVFRSPAGGIGGIGADSLDYIYLFNLDGKIYKISLP